MLDENDKKWIVEKTGALIRQEFSQIDSRTRWHSSEIADLRIGWTEHREALEILITANNQNAEMIGHLAESVAVLAESVATLSGKIDQFVDVLPHPAGNGRQ